MLIWEAPSKRFLTLGPSRVVNPIHTKENKFQELGLFTRDWTSTQSDSWSDQSFKYNCFYPRCKCSLRNSYIIRNLKRLLFIEFCLDLLRGKFKAFCRFFATVNPLPPRFFFSPPELYWVRWKCCSFGTIFWLKEGSVFYFFSSTEVNIIFSYSLSQSQWVSVIERGKFFLRDSKSCSGQSQKDWQSQWCRM